MNKIPFVLLLFLVSCHPRSTLFEPHVSYSPQRYQQSLPSAFPRLSPNELREDWGKEILIGQSLGKEFDLYRALTSFKRSLILMPKSNMERRQQVEYSIAYSYYLGRMYPEVLESFECTDLRQVPPEFPALKELSIILYDAYTQTGQPEKARRINQVIAECDPAMAENLTLASALMRGDLCQIPPEYLSNYYRCCKSARTAQTLSAIIPGMGYAYVGQYKSAVTSFILNALFIAATVQFAQRDFIPAAIIAGSFEMGWYLGGINGAGLAAKEYNERLYECQIKDIMLQKRLFPALMLSTSF